MHRKVLQSPRELVALRTSTASARGLSGERSARSGCGIVVAKIGLNLPVLWAHVHERSPSADMCSNHEPFSARSINLAGRKALLWVKSFCHPFFGTALLNCLDCNGRLKNIWKKMVH